MDYRQLSLSQIDPPSLIVRAEIKQADIDSLAWSMKAVGQIEPISVCRRGERFEILAGHRRYLAAQLNGWEKISARIVTVKESKDGEAIKLHENLYRADITEIEEASYFAQLVEQGSSIEELARLVRHPDSYVRARLKLLELAPEIIEALAHRQINLSVACTLNRCVGEGGRKALLYHAIHDGCTASVCGEWVQNQNFADGAADHPNLKGLSPDKQAEMEADRMWHCLLCGEDRDKWEMMVKMVHRSCLKIAEMQGAFGERIETRDTGGIGPTAHDSVVAAESGGAGAPGEAR